MIETLRTDSPKIVGFKLQGKLHDEDYQQFTPALESALASEGKLRLFAEMEDFHGWDMHAMWDDFKFGMKHYSDFERIAMVGDQNWESWMASLCKPFTGAKVRYFDHTEKDVAWQWIHEGMQPAAAS